MDFITTVGVIAAIVAAACSMSVIQFPYLKEVSFSGRQEMPLLSFTFATSFCRCEVLEVSLEGHKLRPFSTSPYPLGDFVESVSPRFVTSPNSLERNFVFSCVPTEGAPESPELRVSCRKWLFKRVLRVRVSRSS